MESIQAIKKTILVILLVLFAVLADTWQSQAQIAPMSNAAALARYGEMPVSMYTGTSGASIGLTEAGGKDISIPISLSYHGGGIRVRERASNVGLGWTLNAGGVVTRTVFGKPDEQAYFKQSESTKTKIGGNTVLDRAFLLDIVNGVIDTEPDAFYFNIGGRSGKFYFNSNQQPVLESYAPLQILTDPDLTSFTIIDENGYRYFFNEKESSTYRIMKRSVWSDFSTPYTSSWYLNSITSPTGETTTFIYEGYLSEQMDRNEGDKFIMTGQGGLHQRYSGQPVYAVDGEYVYNSYYGDFGYSEESGYEHSRTGQCKRISKISFLYGYITFKYSPRGDHLYEKKLDLISMFARDEYSTKLVNRIYLEYDYYQNMVPLNVYDEVPPELTVRLRLKKIYAKNIAQQSSPPYLFDYEGNTLPFFYSNGQDHQGYYNGQDSNPSLTPTIDIQGGLYAGSDRQSNFEYAKKGILTKITYPSGNSTSFEYEAHKDDLGNILGGGLRIKGITDKDENGNTVFQKGYRYGQPVATPYPVYHYPALKAINISGLNRLINVEILTTYNNSKLGMGGNRVFYRNVAEIIGESEGPKKYRNEYEYFYNPDPDAYYPYNEPINGGNPSFKYPFKHPLYNGIPDAYIPVDVLSAYRNFPFPQFPIEHPLNGALLTMRSYGYDENTAGFYKIKEVQNLFTVETARNKALINCLKVGAYVISPYYIKANGSIPSFFTAEASEPFKYFRYQQKSYWSYLSGSTEKVYPDPTDSTKVLTTSARYSYSNSVHAQITHIESTNSEQVKTIQRFKYALDYQEGNITDPQSLFITQMKLKNIVALPIEVQSWQQKAGEQNPSLTGGMLTAYDPVFFKPVQVWETELKEPITGFNNEGYFMSDLQRYIPKVRFTYDGKGNLLEQHNMETGQAKTYFWDNRKLFVSAQVILAKSAQVFHTSFEDEEGNSTVEGDAKTGEKSRMDGYSKTLGNLPEGTYVLSHWQKINGGWVLNTEDIQVTGQGNTGIGSYQIQLAGQVDEVRFHPKTSLMSTTAFKMGKGVVSVMDANHKTIYYEYDLFNRLLLVRDENKNILQKYDYRIFNK